jgi:hypothetical protein
MTVREARVIMASDIAKNLFPNNGFFRMAINDDDKATASKVILPQAGGVPNAVVNRTTYPLPVVTRQDTVTEYSINEISTDVTRIAYKDMLAANYSMSLEVVDDHSGVLQTKAFEDIAFRWSATGDRVVRTDGTSRSAIAASATGNRLKATGNNVLGIKRKMDADEIPEDGRIALLNSEMLNDLLEDHNLLGQWQAGERMIVLGKLEEIWGFKVFMRSTLLRYNNAGAAINLGAQNPVLSATDDAGSLFWHPRFTRSAFYGVKTFIDLDDPSYQADLFSALVLCGGSKRYADGRGVYSLVEGKPA